MKVREAARRGMITVKGDLEDEALRGAVGEAAGVGFPDLGAARISAGHGALWMAPDEILVLVDPARRNEALGGLRQMAAGRHVLVEDVSDMRTGFVLEGAAVRDVLARVTPADVSPAALPPGRVRRTRVGQVAAALWLPEEGRAEVLCFRSVADYTRRLLAEAAASEPLGLFHVGGKVDVSAAPEQAAAQFHHGGNDMAFTLPDLPYSHDALSGKGMSRETLEYHHDIHHKTYADTLNKLISGTEWEGKPIEEIVRGNYDKNAVAQNGIFNNASQYWNHNQFWEMMTPEDSKMPGELERRITEAFGSVDKFKEEFAAAGAGQFGSGWCWLVAESDGSLKVTKTENGVDPLCFNQTALLGCDVWEHSYYIDFRNKRPAYLQNFLDKLVNWENVASRLPA